MIRFFGSILGRGEIKPKMIAQKIKRLMNTSQTESRFKIFVPARYRVLLSETDLQQINKFHPTVISDLIKSMELYADQQDFYFSSPLEILFQAKTGLGERLRVEIISECSTGQTKVFTRPKIKEMETSACLEILTGSNQGEKLPLAGENITLGRREDNQIMLEDADVSRYHARIVLKKHWQIIDLNSTNGVFVNGKQIKSSRLKSEDEIRLGSTLLKFSLK